MEADQHKKAMMIARATAKLGMPFESLNAQQKKQLAQNCGFKLRTLAVRTLFLRKLFSANGTRRKTVEVEDELVKAKFRNVAESLVPVFRSYGLEAEAIRKVTRFRYFGGFPRFSSSGAFPKTVSKLRLEIGNRVASSHSTSSRSSPSNSNVMRGTSRC
jgi:hypothetical protein